MLTGANDAGCGVRLQRRQWHRRCRRRQRWHRRRVSPGFVFQWVCDDASPPPVSLDAGCQPPPPQPPCTDPMCPPIAAPEPCMGPTVHPRSRGTARSSACRWVAAWCPVGSHEEVRCGGEPPMPYSMRAPPPNPAHGRRQTPPGMGGGMTPPGMGGGTPRAWAAARLRGIGGGMTPPSMGGGSDPEIGRRHGRRRERLQALGGGSDPGKSGHGRRHDARHGRWRQAGRSDTACVTVCVPDAMCPPGTKQQVVCAKDGGEPGPLPLMGGAPIPGRGFVLERVRGRSPAELTSSARVAPTEHAGRADQTSFSHAHQ